MRVHSIVLLAALLTVPEFSRAQVGGNIGYSDASSSASGKAGAEETERRLRTFEKRDVPPSDTSTFVDAHVLMNVKADEHVAVFAASREGATPAECQAKLDATLSAFLAELKAIGVENDATFVDFVAQVKLYGFESVGGVWQEKLVGFEQKKTISVRYRDPAFVERLLAAAAKAEIYDLVKVNYVVKDVETVHDRLMEEAAAITKRKIARYERLLGVKLTPPAQVYAERTAIHYPTELYDSYRAHESQEVRSDHHQLATRSARKTQTFFFHGLDGDGFDKVINPVVDQPVVQFTLYLKLKYEVEQAKAE